MAWQAIWQIEANPPGFCKILKLQGATPSTAIKDAFARI
jgi:hypothetical protein